MISVYNRYVRIDSDRYIQVWSDKDASELVIFIELERLFDKFFRLFDEFFGPGPNRDILSPDSGALINGIINGVN